MGNVRIFHVSFFDASGNRLLHMAMLARSELIAAHRAVRISRDIAAADFYMTMEPQSTGDNVTEVAFSSMGLR